MTQGKKLLSVAVPAYNAQAYLEKCLASFALASPEVLARLEIIVVNDGSTDLTGEIAGHFCAQYPEVFSLITKENGGHGSGINVAARLATGEYFRVVDADDWVVTENLPAYLHLLETSRADAVVTAFHRVDMHTGGRSLIAPPDMLCGASTLDALSLDWGKLKNVFTIHGITYKMRKYAESGTVLTEQVFYEDNEYITFPFCCVASVFLSDLVVYQYLVGNAEQSVAAGNQVKRLPQLEQVLWRVCAFWSTLSEAAVKRYALEKLADLAVSYESVCLLKMPSRKEGRRLATAFTTELRLRAPAAYHRVRRRTAVLRLLHLLRLKDSVLDVVVCSPTYRLLRNFKVK